MSGNTGNLSMPGKNLECTQDGLAITRPAAYVTRESERTCSARRTQFLSAGSHITFAVSWP